MQEEQDKTTGPELRADPNGMRAEHMTVLREVLWTDPCPPLTDSVHEVLEDYCGPGLVRSGLISESADPTDLRTWLERIMRIIHALSQEPWVTHSQIERMVEISRQDMVLLSRIIRESPDLQDLIVRHGIGREYWKTAIELGSSGMKEDVLNGRYSRPPLYLALFPGMSCMFDCTFCGRNPTAKYDRSALENGIEVFDRIFAEVAQDAPDFTIVFGGGLEPLTHPKIGNTVTSAKSHGLKTLLMTNGHMLTPKYVQRQEGLLDLDVLRVSIYGVDEESYLSVTKKPKAFDLVMANVVEFLKRRNDVNPNLKVGWNFVILPGCTAQVMKLIDLIEGVNAQVPNGRGIDVLSLREDFTLDADAAISTQERSKLIDVFAEVKRRALQPGLNNLNISFGYSLYALSEGNVGKPLSIVTNYNDLRPKAYTQVSVVVDILGDVYAYREAGFLDRPGAHRYKIGTVTAENSLRTVIQSFLDSGAEFDRQEDDNLYLDALDHVITRVLNQVEDDAEDGVPFGMGCIKEFSDGRNAGTVEKPFCYV